MTSGMDVVYLTEEGLEQIQQELHELKTVRREEIAIKLEEAIAQGDLKENADYHDAKEEQAFVEGRIRDLEDALRRAKVIKETGPTGVVRVGSTVTVSEEGFDEEETYSIVGAQEADPSNGRISNESPLGRALLGARVGEVVVFDSPGGEVSFEIRDIS